MMLLLTLPACFCVGLLLVHSLLYRPLRATLILFAFIIPASMLYASDDYVFNPAAVKIGGVPIMNIVGFTFAYYCSYSLAVHILEPRDRETRTIPVWKLTGLAILITMLIGGAIEYVDMAAQWWTWTPRHDQDQDFLSYCGAWELRPLIFYPVLSNFFVRRSRSARVRARVVGGLYFLGMFLFLNSVPFLLARAGALQVVAEATISSFFLLMPLFLLLLKGPMVSLEQFQWDEPRPLSRRWKEYRERKALANRARVADKPPRQEGGLASPAEET